MPTPLKISAAVLALALTVTWIGQTVAQEPTPSAEGAPAIATDEATAVVLPEVPGEESIMERPPVIVDPHVEELVPPAVATACHPIHVVRDSASRSAKRMYRCYGPPVNQTLCVENPANCCLYAVHVCVPACCVGEPVCCGTRVGLLGRGYVVYQWPCGFEVEIAFRVHGGVILKYR